MCRVLAYIGPEIPVENLLLNATGTGTGNGLANYMQGSSAADVLNGKGGRDWLVGGGGSDTFVFEKGNGLDFVEDFKSRMTGAAQPDLLKFVGYGSNPSITHEGDLWSIHHDGGVDQIRLINVTSLSASDYVGIVADS